MRSPFATPSATWVQNATAVVRSIGNKKLTLSDPLDVYVSKWTATYQLESLPVQSAHVVAIVGLPLHHKDPFDRVLVAQAQVEGMTLVTADVRFGQYIVPILW